MRGLRAIAPVVAIVVIAVGTPYVVPIGQMTLAQTVMIDALFAVSVNLLFGRAGVPTFGQAAFFGTGAYTAALTSVHIPQVVPCLLISFGVSGVAAALCSLATARSSGLAFSMLTLAIGQLAYTAAQTGGFFGGYNGLSGIPFPKVGSHVFVSTYDVWYFVSAVAGIGLLVLLYVWKSPFGYLLVTIREDAHRAAGLGINTRYVRAIAFTVSGAFAGLAGALYAYTFQAVSPENLFWTVSATPVVMLLLGGRNFFWGPAIGALVYHSAIQLSSGATSNYNLYIGAIFVIIVIYVPGGILSIGTSVWTALRRRRPRGAPIDTTTSVLAGLTEDGAS
ncbi:MAG TPA: branched-chain amino acid ABC transporter permease [Marmoricola sp.]|nr:branched-chain amino acid ABC transporter permease [Marmoricola sp.]